MPVLPNTPSSISNEAEYIVQRVQLCRDVLFKAGELTGFPHKTVMELTHEKERSSETSFLPSKIILTLLKILQTCQENLNVTKINWHI